MIECPDLTDLRETESRAVRLMQARDGISSPGSVARPGSGSTAADFYELFGEVPENVMTEQICLDPDRKIS